MFMALLPWSVNAQDLIDEYELEWVYKYSAYELADANPDSVFGFYEYGSVYSPDEFTEDVEQLTTELLNCKNLQYLELHNILATDVLDRLDEFPLLQVLVLDNVGMGTVPDGIYYLDHLKRLELSYFNDLKFDTEGLLGNQIHSLSLENIVIGCDSGNCELPLDYFPELTKLKLRGEFYNLPASLYECTNLVELDVAECYLEYIDPEIGNLVMLETVILSSNADLDDLPDEFGYLENLKTLDISGTAFYTLPYCLEYCTSLESLDASYSSLEELPYFIESLTSLYDLRLNGTLISALPDELKYCSSLNYLSLYGCGFSEFPAVIGELSNLLELDMSYCYVNTIPASLSGAKMLSRLDLSGNPIERIESGAFALPELYRLNMANCGLRQIDPEIFRLTALAHLDLSGDSITTIPAGLYSLKSLSSLNLSGNQIATIPKGISGLTALYELDLSTNKVTALPKDLTACANLNYLTVPDNQIKKLPKGMNKLTNLGSIDVRGNKNIAIKGKEIAKIPSFYIIKLRPDDISESALKKLKAALGEESVYVSEY